MRTSDHGRYAIRAESAPRLRTAPSMANHQARILRLYLAITTTVYGLGVAATFVPNKPITTGNVTGGVLAVVLGLVALALLRWVPRTPRTYAVCTSLAIAASPIVIGFVVLLAALVICSVGAMFLAMYIEAFHQPKQARVMVAVLLISVFTSIMLSPAPLNWFGALAIAAAIGSAAVVYGSLTKALIASSTTDPLTGVLNRVGLELATARAFESRRTRAAPVSVVALDVDEFKAINDTQGHQAGDELLGAIAQHWSEMLPASAIVARIGGDEFSVVLLDCDLVTAHRVTAMAAEGSPAPLSYGIASAAGLGVELPALYREADARLYAAKRARRRRRTG